MYAVEFEASIENGVVHIPKDYRNIYNQKKAHIFIIPIEKEKKEFDPKEFFGAGKSSKNEIDEYLNSSLNEWEIDI